MRMVSVITLTMLVLCYSAHANDEDNCQEGEIPTVTNESDVIVTDHSGRRWTDLHMLYRKIGCIPRTPKLDTQTVQNAKFLCDAKGAKLPTLGEVDILAEWLSKQFFVDDTKATLKARFMSEQKHFWTETVKADEGARFIYKRALARLSHLEGSGDMAKAEAIYVPADQDKEFRPFLCVFEPRN